MEKETRVALSGAAYRPGPRPAGKRRRKRKCPLARRGSRISLWDLVSKAGRKRCFPKKGRGTWMALTSVRPDRLKDQRSSGSQVGRLVRLFSRGSGRREATPELVSQDREAGCQTFRGAGPGRPNTGISFARRSGGWQQCRPPFLIGRHVAPSSVADRAVMPLRR